MQKLFIKNRSGLKICVVIENAGADKLAFVQHGYGSNKDRPQIREMVKTLIKNNFCTISFDNTHSSGESEGDILEAIHTHYYNDLIDVINWAKPQDFYREKFFLAGHSSGSLITFYYATKNSDKISGLFSPSLDLGGKEFAGSRYRFQTPEFKEKGFIERETNGIKKRVTQDYVDDLEKYDVFEDIDKINMPILMMVMSEDKSTPLKNQELVYNKLNNKGKKLVIFEGEGHTFKGEFLEKMKIEFDKFLKQYF